jgi:RNA polymerase sigma factor (sigma-70 family)
VREVEAISGSGAIDRDVVTLGPREHSAATPDFDAMFRVEFPRVARTVHHIVGDRARAEEITQDAFVEMLRFWRRVHRYDRPDLWVRRVAVRKAQRELHRAVRRVELERRAAPRPVVEPPTAAPEVLAAVRRLAPKQRAVVVLFYFEDRPMAEIAEILGCSESTGWSQLHTARRHLATVLRTDPVEEVSDDGRG